MRPEKWPSMLVHYLDDIKGRPFAWGTHDCVSFTADWFRLMTGRDVYAPWRARYGSKLGAWRLIKKAGADDMRHAGKILFGNTVGAGEINRGDIALAQNAFGIVTGTHGIFLTPGDGLLPVPIREFQAAWSV